MQADIQFRPVKSGKTESSGIFIFHGFQDDVVLFLLMGTFFLIIVQFHFLGDDRFQGNVSLQQPFLRIACGETLETVSSLEFRSFRVRVRTGV